jgi:hypothetical protein
MLRQRPNEAVVVSGPRGSTPARQGRNDASEGCRMILGEVRNKRGVRAMQEMWTLPSSSEAGRSSSGQAPAVADMFTNAHESPIRPEPLPI